MGRGGNGVKVGIDVGVEAGEGGSWATVGVGAPPPQANNNKGIMATSKVKPIRGRRR